MKICTTILLSIFSTALFAMPSVGDMAVYLIDLPGSGSFFSKVELIDYNKTNDTFTQKSTGYTEAGIFSTITINVEAKKLLTNDQLLQKIRDCESNGGNLEMIQITTGDIKTCAKNIGNNGIENSGVVPFGIVRVVSPSVTAELLEYNIGK